MVRRVSREGSRHLSSAWSTTNDSASTGGAASEGKISLRDFLHRFDAGSTKQKVKGLPNVLFDPPSPGQMAQLEAITIFGLDIPPVDVGDAEDDYVPDYGFSDGSGDEGAPSSVAKPYSPEVLVQVQIPRAGDSNNAPINDVEEDDEAAAAAYYASEDRFEEDDDNVQDDDAVEEPDQHHPTRHLNLATPSPAIPQPVAKHRTPLILSSDDDEIVIRKDTAQRRQQVRRRPRGESSFQTPQREVVEADEPEVVAESAGEKDDAGDGSDGDLSDYERESRQRGDTELDRPSEAPEADDAIVVEDQGADDIATDDADVGNDEIDADEPHQACTDEIDADEPASGAATRQLTSTQSRGHAEEIDSSLSHHSNSQSSAHYNHTTHPLSSPRPAASPPQPGDRTPVRPPKRRREAEASTVSNDSAASTSTSRSAKRLRRSPAPSTAPPAEQRTPATPPTSMFSFGGRMNPLTWFSRKSKTSQESAASKGDEDDIQAEPAEAAEGEEAAGFIKATPSSPSPPLKEDLDVHDGQGIPAAPRRQKFNGELSRDLAPLFRVKGLTAAQTKKLLEKGLDARAKQRKSLAGRKSDTQRRA
ncbi:uncharacterized protein LOC62_05G007739 [Vanrija pseudolonga]|uniref:Uncharacterized protein n=1 Tax=Vanrija pseudolonga TaxID=143232 RepID=A0AAF0YII3_9TREE|nr:hypothetical protein LOC62_05G007739 [Vanrija pseudolonga]